MITIKQKYNQAKSKAVDLMSQGLLKEYILQLKYVESLRKSITAINN